jgi:hypothetical protein
MAITLAEVTYDIVEQVVALKVREDQKDLVRDPRQSLNIAASEQDLRALAIYADEVLVGFCMYGTDEEDGANQRTKPDDRCGFSGQGILQSGAAGPDRACAGRAESRGTVRRYPQGQRRGRADFFPNPVFQKPARSRTANWSGCTATEPTGHPGFPPVSPSRAIRGG